MPSSVDEVAASHAGSALLSQLRNQELIGALERASFHVQQAEVGPFAADTLGNVIWNDHPFWQYICLVSLVQHGRGH